MQDPHVASSRVFARIGQDAEVDCAAADDPFTHTGEPVAHPERHRRGCQVFDGLDQIHETAQGLRRWATIGEESIHRRDDVGLRPRRNDQFADQAGLAALAGHGGGPSPGVVQHAIEEGLGVLAAQTQAGVAIAVGLRQDRGRLQVLGHLAGACGRLRDCEIAATRHDETIARGRTKGNRR
uniref:Uncharacterized protein n=1 Tax=Caulobacter sp. (strain K31) TaxID=366602 RepID=B0T875_CAUSK